MIYFVFVPNTYRFHGPFQVRDDAEFCNDHTENSLIVTKEGCVIRDDDTIDTQCCVSMPPPNISSMPWIHLTEGVSVLQHPDDGYECQAHWVEAIPDGHRVYFHPHRNGKRVGKEGMQVIRGKHTCREAVAFFVELRGGAHYRKYWKD